MNIRPKIDSIKGSMFHHLSKNVKNAKITSKQSKVITSGKFFLLEAKVPAIIPIINPGNPDILNIPAIASPNGKKRKLTAPAKSILEVMKVKVTPAKR